MKITVKLFATLREFGEKQQDIDVAEGTLPKDIVEALKIPVDDVAIIMINGRGSKIDTVLKENDTLALFPPVGGG